MNDKLVFHSLSEYIESVRVATGLSIAPVSVKLPIGPAADRYLWDAMCVCCEDETKTISFTAPCIRREKKNTINDGSHLSLFFLMFFVFGQKVDGTIVDSKYRNITNVEGITVKEILSHKETSFAYGGFDFRQKFVPSARNFSCNGYAYEMFDEKEIEICNIADFTMKDNGKHCVVFAFGVERMIMHLEGKIDVWKTKPFCEGYIDATENYCRDRMRKQYYKKTLGNGKNEEMICCQTCIF